MTSADCGEIQLDEDTYNLAEKCAKKLGLTVDEFVRKAIDEKHEKLQRQKITMRTSRLSKIIENHLGDFRSHPQ